MPTATPITHTVSIQHDGDVWRATLGEHSANALDPFDAVILVVGKAREAGLQLPLVAFPSTPDESAR